MLKLVLWSILAIWVGIAVAIFGTLVLTVVLATTRMIRDRFGKRSSIYCPVHERTFAVVGIPTSFGAAPFDDLRRCEPFGDDEVRCQKSCLKWEQYPRV